MEVMHCRCAGLDVHKKSVVVCALVGEAGEAPQVFRGSFGTTTRALLELHDWLRERGVSHVAMEATGTYWKPVWAILEDSFDLTLSNAAHIKQVPGRKTDQKDADWIADLLRHGLLKKSFVPPLAQQDLRELTRHRIQVTGHRSAVSNRISKLLEGANIKLGSVASDVMGVSGQRMLDALVAGETDPEILAGLAIGSLRKKHEALVESLRGRVRSHHRTILRLLLAEWRFLDRLLQETEQAIEEAVCPFREAATLLQTMPGMKATAAYSLVAELGVNMGVFPDGAHAASWAGICPGNHESAGKRYSGRTRNGNRWLKRTLCQVAWAASHTRGSYFHAQHRRIAAKRGKKRAIVALAHSILVTAYTMLKRQCSYQDLGADCFEKINAEGLKRYCIRKLEQLGHRVVLETAA
jgi:transposase